VANARAAGADALTFPMTTGGAPAHAGLAVSRGRECGRTLLVPPRRGGLRAREAQGAALRCKGGTRQQCRDNDAQHKTHDASPFSIFTLTHKGMFRISAAERTNRSDSDRGLPPSVGRPQTGRLVGRTARTIQISKHAPMNPAIR